MNITLSDDQARAVSEFEAFAADPNQRIFALAGYAGSGKTFTYSRMAKHMRGSIVLATPTHKATNVIRRALRAAGVAYQVADGKPAEPGKLITGTTAQLLGIRPSVSDEQGEKTREFSAQGGGILAKNVGIDWVVIDEVSMLSKDHLDRLEVEAAMRGFKLLIIGDPGQLPPVNSPKIEWESLPNVVFLKQIMRQSGDSAIPLLAQAVRLEEDWRSVQGAGVTHDPFAGKAFLDQVSEPAADEKDRSVFIAYRNAVVDEVQELACREVYGHGRSHFQAGQRVICESRVEKEVMTYLAKYGRSYPRRRPVANNADEIIVREFGDKGQWGTVVELQHADSGDVFNAEYLSPEEMKDRNHPFNVAVSSAMTHANELQAKWKSEGSPRGSSSDERRKDAWSYAFDLRDGTVISFRHPFALTSHKSQGSTYKRAFVDAGDIEQFAKEGLYVAATRPSEELVIG